MENKKGVSIYKQVAKEVENKVKAGIYVTAQKLPSEAELAQEFNVSRLTVRKAINLLIEKKVLVKHQNTGTYVMNHHKLASGGSGLQGFNEVAKANGKTPRTEVMGVYQIDYDGKLWEELEAKAEEIIINVNRIRYLDDLPMTVEDLYIRQKFLPEAIEETAFENSIFELIEQKIAIAYSHQEIEAVLVDKMMSIAFEIPVGQPMFRATSNVFSVTGVPIMHDISYYRSDEYVFSNTLVRSKN
ncbi:GntR family transcriptional regulator, LSA1692 subfamily [Pseudolactococcus reticulitermitis]|uniref:HTH gntR-type domain-containing protein n=1 Tax=Pseudolactococcus reticulitermitis TaxID=2025039 RepID=A0A224X0X8_9LACT|nr:GntR family transcriptional regulator, LSA1692 subfamily [Lactococcus reticulitermitis]GAX47867.1 hypothetical protein RsY01_1471 [Lactococcus reticulitermitis]